MQSHQFVRFLSGISAVDPNFSADGDCGTACVRRGTPHCFKNCSDKRARVLIFFTPGDIQGFFDYGKALENGSAPPDDLGA